VEFLRPYRGTILLALLIESVLLLPIPHLQGWVDDRLVAFVRAGGIVPTSVEVGPGR